MKKIAIIIPTLDKIGGAENQLLLLANGLKDRGWWVSVVCLSGNASVAANKFEDINCILLKMKHGLKDPAGWLRFIRWLRHEHPTVVHAHLPHAVWLARWSRLLAPVRVQLDTIHTAATGSWGRRIGYRLSRWLPNRVTAVSQSVAEIYLHAKMLSNDQLTILPNGVELGDHSTFPAEHQAARAQLGLNTQFEWLAIGRLETVKDYPTLLRAFAPLPQNAKLSIAGVGSEEIALRRLADELGIQSRIRWLGFVDNLSPWLQAADAYVLTSLWEGLPVGVLEASAHGLPVVATYASGVHDALPEDNAFWLTPVKGIEALSRNMQRMMHLTQEERREIGEHNFKFAQANFSLAKILNQWEILYEKLLAENPTPRRWSR